MRCLEINNQIYREVFVTALYNDSNEIIGIELNYCYDNGYIEKIPLKELSSEYFLVGPRLRKVSDLLC